MAENTQQSLNIRSPALKGMAEESSEGLREAVKRHMLHKETFDEAWERIFALKNTEAEVRKLHEVKQAMEDGSIERSSERSAKKFSRSEALELHAIIAEREKAEILRKMVEDTPDNYRLITDMDDLDSFLMLLESEDEIVFDVETTGTDVWEDYLVGHVITAVNANIHVYIPTKHDVAHAQLPHDYVIEKLRPYYENESLGKIAHNASYDIHILDREGISLKGLTWDTLEAMKLLNENEMTYALKPLVSKYLHEPSQTYGELFGKKGFHEVPLDQALAYAAKDGDVTLRLRDFQRHHMAKMPSVLDYFETVEIPLIPITVEMEKEGYVMDLTYAREYGEQLRKEAEESRKIVVKNLGDINLNSPVQLKAAIEELILKPIENTDAKQTLKPLSKKWPTIAELLNYREKNKLLSTYIDALPNKIRNKTGKLHGNFNPNGTKTGRYSSNNPNLFMMGVTAATS